MKADPYDVKTIFGFERQLYAPLFQRPYVWTEEQQWEPFWHDVRRVADELLAERYDCRPHFLGAVVLEQIKVPIGKPDARSIIDGQQTDWHEELIIARANALFDVAKSIWPYPADGEPKTRNFR